MDKERQIKVDVLRKDIDDLQNQQQKLVVDFNAKNSEIESVVADYNTKITKLQKDGQIRVDQLDNEREQIRGAYQALNTIIEGKQQQLNELLGSENGDSKKDVKPKKEKVDKSSGDSTGSSLTQEQIKELEVITNKSEKIEKESTPDNQITKSDIPEYLQDEYKKLK